MERFADSYAENVARMCALLRPQENFDVLKKQLAVGTEEMTLFYLDGFTKGSEGQKLMQYFLSLSAIGTVTGMQRKMPHIESERCDNTRDAVRGVLSGQTLLLATHFGAQGILIDLRTYPSRGVSEPEGDRVMQGARDGFTETLVVNTALLRRRIRDPRLTLEYCNLGGMSGTDAVICYMRGVADERCVSAVKKRLGEIRPTSLTMGFQSLAESLIRTHWYNPFPKIRTTERPDTAAAQVAEGSVLLICDTSPQVMILPTGLLDYLQQTGDYYYPPLTGTYLRLLRTVILMLSVVATPLWYLLLQIGDALPEGLRFLIPDAPGALPILLQLYLAEIAIDGLKIASMNTPDILSNSLSVVGALLLSDFAVGVGWFCEDVILYMAFAAIATFAQQNHELGYAFKFMRMMILALTAWLGVVGFFAGLVLFCVFAATNKTVGGGRGYLYPLIPFNGRALCHLLFRTKKSDFDDSSEKEKRARRKPL